MEQQLIKPMWQTFPDSTAHILVVLGVQVASIQETDDSEPDDLEYCLYTLDSEWEKLFDDLSHWETKNIDAIKNVVEERFLIWLDKSFKELGGSITLAE